MPWRTSGARLFPLIAEGQARGGRTTASTHSSTLPRSTGLANVSPREKVSEEQQRKLALLSEMDRDYSARAGKPDAVESAIANWELAFRMQAAVPDLMGIEGETDETKRLYGLEASHKNTQIFGRQCLLARRLVERGIEAERKGFLDGRGGHGVNKANRH